MRVMLAVMGLATLAASGVRAHHSYGDVLQDQNVTIVGELTDVLFGNPHVMLTIQTDDSRRYTAEWASLQQLARFGVTQASLQPGDRVSVIGSPARDPAVRRITLLKEVRRLRDGWVWLRPERSQ